MSAEHRDRLSQSPIKLVRPGDTLIQDGESGFKTVSVALGDLGKVYLWGESDFGHVDMPAILLTRNGMQTGVSNKINIPNRYYDIDILLLGTPPGSVIRVEMSIPQFGFAATGNAETKEEEFEANPEQRFAAHCGYWHFGEEEIIVFAERDVELLSLLDFRFNYSGRIESPFPKQS